MREVRKKSSNLAPIEEEILFSIAMGFNPWELKKDWNGKRDTNCKKIEMSAAKNYTSTVNLSGL